MTDKTQPWALMLADRLHHEQHTVLRIDAEHAGEELRRQYARIAELEAQLEAVGAGGVSGPLMGHPSPPEGMVGGWTKASQQLPPCGDGQLFIGVNSAGFACVFNEITSNIVGAVHCLYETAEECIDVMSGLDLWRPFNPPTSSADSRKGE